MATKRNASQGAEHAGQSSQARGAQGWKQLNSPAGETVAAKSAKKEPAARAKQPAKTAAKPAKPTPARASRRKKSKPDSDNQAKPPTRDTAIIDWVLSWPRHVWQGFVAGILLIFTIFLAVALLTRTQSGALAGLGNAVYGLVGWGAYLLVIGLAAFAIANLAEAATQTRIIRLGLVIELTLLGLALVLESRLFVGANAGALVGTLLAEMVSGLPGIEQQIAVWGAIIILLLLIFQVTWSQAIGVAGIIFGELSRLVRSASNSLSAAAAQRRQTRAARAQQMLAEQDSETDPEEEADLQGSPANLPRQTFPRLRRRAESVVTFDEEDDFESVRLPGAGAAVDALDAAQQAPLPGITQRGAGAAKGSEAAGQTPWPQLPPLPMKPGTQQSGTSGPLPVIGATPTPHYELPAITLLNGVVEQRQLRQEDIVEELAAKVERTLRSFRVDAEVRRSDISIGPTVIRIGIRPVEKVKRDYRGHVVVDEEGEPVLVRTRVSRIMALQNDLALDLEAKSIRMEAPVPGRPYVGVEVPNKHSRLVTLREILASKEYEESRRKSKLTIALGRDVAGRARVGDIARFPHLLIAGATGSGKSVCVNSIIACLLMQAMPEDVRFLMIDPKMVELTGFNGIPHLLAPVVTEVDKVVGTLKRGVIEMERRYRLFSRLGVRNLEAYRKLRAQRPELDTLPNIIIIIDELADLMMAAPEEIENLICRLAQLARATGIHLVIATQRPSVDVITGLIKANIPTRISFMVSSAIDSRTILDSGGAERLLGRGDMLYLPADAGKPERIQGTFLADDELERIVDHWRQTPAMPRRAEPSWEPEEADEEVEPEEDDLFEEAEQVVREAGRASASLLQQKLRVGYARAARLIDQLEARGVVGPAMPAGRPRDVLPGKLHSPASGGAGASQSGGRSDTMLPGTRFVTGSPLPTAGAHPPEHPSTLPDKRNSGIQHARGESDESDEEVEELEWE